MDPRLRSSSGGVGSLSPLSRSRRLATRGRGRSCRAPPRRPGLSGGPRSPLSPVPVGLRTSPRSRLMPTAARGASPTKRGLECVTAGQQRGAAAGRPLAMRSRPRRRSSPHPHGRDGVPPSADPGRPPGVLLANAIRFVPEVSVVDLARGRGWLSPLPSGKVVLAGGRPRPLQCPGPSWGARSPRPRPLCLDLGPRTSVVRGLPGQQDAAPHLPPGHGRRPPRSYRTGRRSRCRERGMTAVWVAERQRVMQGR